jgi:hypothetical protein
MHPIQDLFLEVFHMYYNLICNFYMHSYVDKNFHSCKKWVLQKQYQQMVVVTTNTWAQESSKSELWLRSYEGFKLID